MNSADIEKLTIMKINFDRSICISYETFDKLVYILFGVFYL